MPDIDFQRIELNLIPKKGDEPVVFYASQYETARPFIADLMWGDTEYAPGDSCWAEIDIRKNDDNLVVITDDVTIDNNEVSVVLPVQAVTCIGKNLGQVKIYEADNQLIAALNFILEVQPDPLAGGVTSETAIDNLESQIAAIVPEVIGDDYYNKTETDALLADKADVSDLPDMSLYYTKTATDTLLNTKADKSDTYTKAQVDTALAAKANRADLATVATSGDYDDLLNKPTIPAAQVQSDYAQADNTQVDYIKNKPDISGMIAAALLAVMPVETATGNPCTFDTDIAAELQGLTADIVATGGNGTPSTPIPIVGHSELNLVRCGVNLFDEANYKNLISDYEYISTAHYKCKSIQLAPNATVTISQNAGTAESSVILLMNNTAEVNSSGYFDCRLANDTKTYTLDSSGKLYIGVYEYVTDEEVNARLSLCNIQINVGSTATAYAPYNGTPYLVQFGQTVYGGVYDANAGKVRITHKKFSFEDFTFYEGSASGGEKRFGSYEVVTGAKSVDNDTAIDGKCDIFNVISANSTYNRVNGFSINSNGNIYCYYNTLQTLSDFTNAIQGHEFEVELATPIEIDVSELSVDTIVGTNNIISDCNGDVTASYKVSIQKYVDDQ